MTEDPRPTRLEARILSFLRAVERGEIQLRCLEPPAWDWDYVVRYRADNGWTISVFCDDGEWGFIFEVQIGDVVVPFTTIADEMPHVMRHRPTDLAKITAWHWDKYCQSRNTCPA